MSCLATLADLRRHLGLRAAETSDDTRLLALLEAVSTELERECSRHFEPCLRAVDHRVTGGGSVILRDDLLVLIRLEDSRGPLPTDEVERIPPHGPAAMLRLPGGVLFAPGLVVVEGWWGWRDDPAAIWTLTGQTVQDDPLHAASAVMTVASTTNFSPGQLLRLDDEAVRVVGLESAQNQLRLTRGQQGTTATAHTPGTAIQTTAPPPDVIDLIVRRAAWLALHHDSLPDALRQPALRWRREQL